MNSFHVRDRTYESLRKRHHDERAYFIEIRTELDWFPAFPQRIEIQNTPTANIKNFILIAVAVKKASLFSYGYSLSTSRGPLHDFCFSKVTFHAFYEPRSKSFTGIRKYLTMN